MIVQVESLHNALEEMKPLLLNHHHEIDWRKDKISFNPDYETYLNLDKNGTILLVTARKDSALVGYVMFIVMPSLHYKDHIYGLNDILYVAPEYRKSGLARLMFDKAHTELKARGCTVSSITMKTQYAFDSLAKSMGYDKVEATYQKWLGE